MVMSEANGKVEVVVEDALKFTSVDDAYLDLMRYGSLEDLHKDSASMKNRDRRPGAATILRESEGERVLPIFMGVPDGLSIWRSMAGWKPPHPFTHDLICSMLETLGFRIKSVSMLKRTQGGVYSEVVLEGVQDGVEERPVNARPSDAIALALRAKAPIYVAEEVFEEEAYESKQAFLMTRGEELGLR